MTKTWVLDKLQNIYDIKSIIVPFEYYSGYIDSVLDDLVFEHRVTLDKLTVMNNIEVRNVFDRVLHTEINDLFIGNLCISSQDLKTIFKTEIENQLNVDRIAELAKNALFVSDPRTSIINIDPKNKSSAIDLLRKAGLI